MGKEREGKTVLYNETNSRILQKTDSVVDAVVDKLINRALVGKAKYGTTLDRGDLSLHEWLNHLQEELLDAANYIEKLKQVLGSSPKV
jgi:hypothetical protein